MMLRPKSRGVKMRALIIAGMVVCASVSLAHADERIAKNGQPFCKDMEHLKEYFTAMLTKNKRYMEELDDCAFFREGIRYSTIEKYDNDSDIGFVSKVRVFYPNQPGSVVGYLFTIAK